MTEIVAMIQHMRAKGIACSVILEAVEALACAKQDALEERRAADRIRKARSRAAQRAALKSKEMCPVTPADSADTDSPSPLVSPPKPPTPPNTPPIIPPSSINPARENAKTPETKGSRLPPDWALPDDWLADAGDIAFKAKTPITEQEIRNEADKFRDYWTAKPGAAGRKLDWRGTWRNWVRSYLDRRPKPRNAPGGHGPAAFGQSGSVPIEDIVAWRALQRRNGDGVPDERTRGDDVPAEADCVEGDYRLVG
jgi:hypothetical protein